jgi:hypothetical protein
VCEIGHFYKNLNHGAAVSNWELGKNVPTMEQWKILKPLLKLDNRFDKLIERDEAEREIIGLSKYAHIDRSKNKWVGKNEHIYETADATPEAQKYNGAYAGYQPKPAVEVVIVAMKPRTEKTYVDQVLNNGKGITWLDDCRVNERFPANLLVSDYSLNDHSKFFDIDAWFAIIPKPSKSEKTKGVEKNSHPTVKPIKLMSYLITLGSRPGEVILDPFMGSGTTGISAKLTGRNFIGFELEEEYFQIAEARINAWETTTVGQDKEDGCKDKEDGKSQPDGTRTGQTTLASN